MVCSNCDLFITGGEEITVATAAVRSEVSGKYLVPGAGKIRFVLSNTDSWVLPTTVFYRAYFPAGGVSEGGK
jgi:hypothetical protein